MNKVDGSIATHGIDDRLFSLVEEVQREGDCVRRVGLCLVGVVLGPLQVVLEVAFTGPGPPAGEAFVDRGASVGPPGRDLVPGIAHICAGHGDRRFEIGLLPGESLAIIAPCRVDNILGFLGVIGQVL
jgi:hypothetical protein